MDKSYVAGVDMGGTNTAAAVLGASALAWEV